MIEKAKNDGSFQYVISWKGSVGFSCSVYDMNDKFLFETKPYKTLKTLANKTQKEIENLQKGEKQ